MTAFMSAWSFLNVSSCRSSESLSTFGGLEGVMPDHAK